MKERLQKVMAHAGIASRRACEELIRDGRVLVNGKVATLGTKVNLDADRILVDGEPLVAKERKRYLLLHKPPGFVTTVQDQFGRKSVMDLLTNVPERVYPVGRLDYDSEGLVFLTNDGALAHRVMHPKFELPKTYLVTVDGEITMDAVYRLRQGVKLEDGLTYPADVSVIHKERERSVLRISISEGRNRQIRRMCETVGNPVVRLTRTAIGPLKLGKLKSGEFRELTLQEIGKLKQAVKG